MFSFVALCSLRVGTHERKSARCRQSSANEKTSARPALRFQKSRGLSRIASSRPIIHRARSTSRATSREIPRAHARRDINSRARVPSSIPRARRHRPARRRVIHHHDHRSVDRDRRCRESGCRRAISISIARARDAHNAPVDIDVKRFLSHRRHDRRNESIDARVSF